MDSPNVPRSAPRHQFNLRPFFHQKKKKKKMYDSNLSLIFKNTTLPIKLIEIHNINYLILKKFHQNKEALHISCWPQ